MAQAIGLRQVLLALLLFFFAVSGWGQQLKQLHVHTYGNISSLDPIQHDALHNMIVFKNVNPRLISLASTKGVTGMLSDSWDISTDRKIWKFHVRPGLTFSDFSPVTAEIIGKNLKRALWVTKDSPLAIHGWLKGISTWKNLNAPLEGVSWKQDLITLKFQKEPIELLEVLEEPIFGVIPTDSFSPIDGRFLDKEYPTAGNYLIEKKSKEELVLRKNPWASETLPQKIIYTWNPIDVEDVPSLKKYDIVMSNSMDSKILKRLLGFDTDMGIAVGLLNGMRFIQLQHLSGPFTDIKFRKLFRDLFFQELKEKNLSDTFFISNSFIPSAAVGYHEQINNNKIFLPKNFLERSVKLAWWPPATTSKANDLLLQAISDVCKKLNLRVSVTKFKERSEFLKAVFANKFDITVRGTGLLPHNPIADLQMMFLSKVGARIPDASGKITNFLKSKIKKGYSSSDLGEISQFVNKQLFEDAAVITFAHVGEAYIYNSSKISFSSFNFSCDPFDAQGLSIK